MNFQNIKPEFPTRRVECYQHVSITDDFGNVMFVGDLVQIHVMPFDYVKQGILKFDVNECKFFVDTDFGKHSLSRYDEYQDMNARIEVIKTFKLIAEGDC